MNHKEKWTNVFLLLLVAILAAICVSTIARESKKNIDKSPTKDAIKQ